jgi:hypothetical protein
MPNTTDYPPKTDSTLEDETIDALEELSESLTAENTEVDVEPKEYQSSEWLEGMHAYDRALHRFSEAKKSIDPKHVTDENIQKVIEMTAKKIKNSFDDEEVSRLRVQLEGLESVRENKRIGIDETAMDDIAAHFFTVARRIERQGINPTESDEYITAYNDFLAIIQQIKNDSDAYVIVSKIFSRQ